MTSHNKQRTNNDVSQQTNGPLFDLVRGPIIGPLTTNKGPIILVLCFSQQRGQIGPITTSHNKQRTNNDLSQQTIGPITTSHNKQRTFVCCETSHNKQLDLCLLWDVVTSHNKQREVVNDLCFSQQTLLDQFVYSHRSNKGPIVRGLTTLVLCLLWEVVNDLSQ